MKHLHTPLSEHDRCELRAGEMFLLSGTIYTARDAAHKRLNDLLDQGKELPLPLQGQIIYYVGPTPTPAGPHLRQRRTDNQHAYGCLRTSPL